MRIVRNESAINGDLHRIAPSRDVVDIQVPLEVFPQVGEHRSLTPICSKSHTIGLQIPLEGIATGAVDAVGSYRARIEIDDRAARRADVRLWAAAPDRVHVEIAGPVGAPRVIADGGAGRLAIAFPAEGVAFVGRGSREHAERALGVELTLDELVAVILEGRAGSTGVEVDRTGRSPGLPSSLRLATNGMRVTLELRGVHRLDAARLAELGRGAPPPGFEVRPIEALERAEVWNGLGP
jgi:hypothetical protein